MQYNSLNIFIFSILNNIKYSIDLSKIIFITTTLALFIAVTLRQTNYRYGQLRAETKANS